eukprot:7607957-Pyramimonas_sp.AAC.1
MLASWATGRAAGAAFQPPLRYAPPPDCRPRHGESTRGGRALLMMPVAPLTCTFLEDFGAIHPS